MSKRQISETGLADVERRAKKVLRRVTGIRRWVGTEATQAAADLVMAEEIRRLWDLEDELRREIDRIRNVHET